MTFAHCANLREVVFEGNAPSIGGDCFYNSNLVTVYYYAGATGFANPWNGKTTVMLYNSTILSVWDIKIQSTSVIPYNVYVKSLFIIA